MTAEPTRPVAIVSGSATGIGAACARRLASHGFNVVINYTRSAEQAGETAAQCREAGAEVVVVRGDVSDDGACRKLVDEAVGRWGAIDVLVNNAGTTRFADPGDLATLGKDDFDRIFSVNVTGAYQLTRAASGRLKRSRYASIVNVSSHSGISGMGSSMAYAASKGALNTLTLSLASALAPEIRVNAVCPGYVDTRWMSGKLNDEDMKTFKTRAAEVAPLKHLVSPDDVAEAVCWFALGGRAITGQLLVIDAGTHLTVGSPL
jgi:3-oxoacyl-[acyl-carrier protein] reductase